MTPAKSTASPTPGPSASKPKDHRAMTVALYNWCRVNYDEEHILSQKDLLEGDIIPNKDPNTLLSVTQSLLDERLFRTHELRGGGIGWKIVSHVSAEKYKDLSADESLVYSVIESAGRSGSWVKNIKSKLNLHQKNVDQSIKTLLQRAYIKPMSTVKYPSRKMYILAGLQPSEDATGGAWFTDGVLDQELLEMLAMALERRISERSWKQVTDWGDASVGLQPGVSRKRKEPHDGLESIKGKEKMRRTNAEDGGDAVLGSSDMEKESHHGPSPTNPQTSAKRPKKVYIPHPAGYQKYPTLPELTSFVNDHNIVQNGKIPENNISQLLDVMVYDDRIHKVNSSSDGSTPTMYRARKNVAQINAESARDERMRDKTIGEARQIKAIREAEIKRLGNGGITEIPCGRCPVFDMCEVGGPVNPNNCEYFEEWFAKLESHQRNGEDVLTW